MEMIINSQSNIRNASRVHYAKIQFDEKTEKVEKKHVFLKKSVPETLVHLKTRCYLLTAQGEVKSLVFKGLKLFTASLFE